MSEDLKDHISIFHDYNICIPTKTIKLFGDIDDVSMTQMITNLHLLDQSSGAITIKLSTVGGEVESGLAIYDAIRAMKNKVNIITYAGVSSMGSVIFQAADKGGRFMTPNSYLMLHHGTSGVVATPKNRANWERLQNYQEDQCCLIYLKQIKGVKPRYTRKKLDEELLTFDTILLPKEAIALGLADEIIEIY